MTTLSSDKLFAAFREPEKIGAYKKRIDKTAGERPLRIMEVCGGHTFSIVRYGLDQLLCDSVEFIHGPGCPVCVMPPHRIDAAIALAERPDTILVTLADMIRVPGNCGSLQQARARGCNVRFVYSPLDTLAIAASNPDKKVIYFAIGFETTTPMTALLAEQTLNQRIKNLYFHINHVLIPPAMALILEQGGEIDAFIGPGHVSVIAGTEIYRSCAETYGKPVVVAGFEPLEILDAVLAILQQVKRGEEASVENRYSRSVKRAGNLKAQQLIEKFFEPRESFLWRGIGSIPASALMLRSQYQHLDAEVQFADSCPEPVEQKPDGCICGEILKGKARPADCPLFAKSCTPEKPKGSCMVGSEGACAAYYKYRRNLC